MQGDERTLLEEISREEGSTDVGIEERAEGLSARPPCQLLLKHEEKELAMRPVLPGSFHSMDAVREHTRSIGSK